MQKETDIMLDKIAVTESQMDAKCHDLFLNKEILAPILQETIEEYEGLSVKEIINLIDEASISKQEAVSDFPLTKDVRIQQTDTDLKSVSDKLVLFDIHFKAALPKDRQSRLNFGLYIDFEPQGIYHPSYPLIKRGMYYAARSLSRQLGELTEETDYGRLQKVYSIWVCYDPKIPKKLKNTVSRYKMHREDFYGKVDEDIFHFDLIEVIMIRIDTSKESKEKIFDYLKGIFTNDKEKIIKQTGPLSDKLIKEVDSMSGVGALIRDTAWMEGRLEGRNEGRNEGLLEGRNEGLLEGRLEGLREGQIKALYQYAGFTIKEISEKLDMSEDAIRKILESLETEDA